VGFEVANYTIGADFINGSNGDLEAEIERVKDEVRVAEVLGAKGMRHDATYGFKPEHAGPKDFDTALPRLIEGCRAVTEFAAERGIKTMVENHGFFCQDSDRVERLVCGVNHPNYGVLIDMGNFLCADEDPGQSRWAVDAVRVPRARERLPRQTRHMPIPGKGWFQSRGGNYLRGAVIGHGDVPIIQCLRIMKRAEYDGVLSVEFEGIEEPIEGIATGLENLRRFVADVYA